VSEPTFYRWKKRFGSLGVPEVRELRQLREENHKLKQLVADLTLDKHLLREALGKRFLAGGLQPPPAPRQLRATVPGPVPGQGGPSTRTGSARRVACIVAQDRGAEPCRADSHPQWPSFRGGRSIALAHARQIRRLS
jgi:hypothetical protein